MPSELAELLSIAERQRDAAHAPPPPVAATRPWFRVGAKQNTPRTAEVWIYDAIGPSWFEDATDAKSFSRQIAALDVDEILLHINSPGGDFFDGVAIYNALKGHPAKVTAVIDGLAASAASFVAQAGDVRRMNTAAQMMIHDASGLVIGNASDMADMVSLLDKISDSIAGIYAARGGGSSEDWRTAMRAETWYTAAEAVEAGLADEAVEEEPPEPPVRNAFDLAIFNYAGRQASPPPAMPSVTARTHTPEPPSSGNKETEGAVADNAKLREALGLAADASDDEVRSALASSDFAADPPPAGNPDGPGAAQADPAPTNRSSNGPVPAGMRIVADSVWEEQQKTIENLRKFVERKQRDERDEVLNQAIRDGKFTPAQRKQFSDLWDESPERAKNLIDTLTRNQALAVNELGHAGYDISDEAAEDSEFDAMFPPEMRYAGKGR